MTGAPIYFGDDRLPPRFWEKVSPEPNSGCWLWAACVNHGGYGRFGVYRQGTQHAHRHAFAVLTARDPGTLFVCHRCDNPYCVNPAHLFLGEHQDNVTDMVAKGRHRSGPTFAANAAKTHCVRGHLLPAERDRRGSRRCRPCATMLRQIIRRRKKWLLN